MLRRDMGMGKPPTMSVKMREHMNAHHSLIMGSFFLLVKKMNLDQAARNATVYLVVTLPILVRNGAPNLLLTN
jgi:hypothetical protein